MKTKTTPAPQVEVEQDATPILVPETGKFIELKRTYQGRKSAERAIVPGIYKVRDPRLFGLADYLIENGHAEYVSGKA